MQRATVIIFGTGIQNVAPGAWKADHKISQFLQATDEIIF
jgi:hypothetical protein